jgi:molybdopterin molybdotransferase
MPVLSPDSALSTVLAAVPDARPLRLAAPQALGLALAEDVIANDNHPPFPRAMMDGYAVRLADAGRTVVLRDEIAAGDTRAHAPLSDGHAHPIMTGAPVPPGAEAVVAQEQTIRSTTGVTLPAAIKADANIVAIGGDLAVGSTVLSAGAVLNAAGIAALAALGRDEVLVLPRPRVTVLTTGSELVTNSAPLAPGQIRDSNGPMLVALCAELGISISRASVPDQPAVLATALERLATHDVTILSGGVSTGTHDDVPSVLTELGYTVLLHGVAQKPGKPLLVARRGRNLLFGLPGNPLASHLCFCRYVAPALRRMQGRNASPHGGTGVLMRAAPTTKDRTWFIPALVTTDDDGWRILPLPPASSADLFTAARANAYLRLEANTPAAIGTRLPFTWIGTNAWL